MRIQMETHDAKIDDQQHAKIDELFQMLQVSGLGTGNHEHDDVVVDEDAYDENGDDFISLLSSPTRD